MLSLNHLLKCVVRSAKEYHYLQDHSNKTKTENFLIKKVWEREVVIINPTLDDGQGDFELARKLEKLIAAKGLQVAIISFIGKYHYESFSSTCSYESRSGKSEKIKNPLVFIAPFSFCKPQVLIQVFKNNVIVTENTKVIMIDEIEASSQYSFRNYKNEFEKIGIKSVYEEKLGFGENCIGYLPIAESEQAAIKQRAKIELERLFNSFHLDLDLSAHYYVSYLNSDVKVTGSQIFIINTLLELTENPSSMNYFFSLGRGNWENDVQEISKGACNILSILEKLDKEVADKFSKLNIILVDVYKNKTFHTVLQSRQEKGIPINLIFMNSQQMPKNVWHNFIALSKSGIMTGDQSLCDYLSIKKEMPFYEIRNWKWPLRQSLVDNAEKFGGRALKEYVQTKFFGRIPSLGDISYRFVNSSMLKDQLKSDFQNFGKFLSQKIATDSVEVYLKDAKD